MLLLVITFSPLVSRSQKKKELNKMQDAHHCMCCRLNDARKVYGQGHSEIAYALLFWFGFPTRFITLKIDRGHAHYAQRASVVRTPFVPVLASLGSISLPLPCSLVPSFGLSFAHTQPTPTQSCKVTSSVALFFSFSLFAYPAKPFFVTLEQHHRHETQERRH